MHFLLIRIYVDKYIFINFSVIEERSFGKDTVILIESSVVFERILQRISSPVQGGHILSDGTCA